MLLEGLYAKNFITTTDTVWNKTTEPFVEVPFTAPIKH